MKRATTGLLALAWIGAMAGQVAAQPAVRPFMRNVAPARSGTPAWFNLRLPGPETDPKGSSTRRCLATSTDSRI